MTRYCSHINCDEEATAEVLIGDLCSGHLDEYLEHNTSEKPFFFIDSDAWGG